MSPLASLGGTVDADAVRFVSGDAIGGTIEYSHTDQVGTIQKPTDASGTLVWDRTARPFGETVSVNAASGVDQKLRFPGQYADETGLSYNYFRDYDPTVGRYLESDPIGLAGSIVCIATHCIPLVCARELASEPIHHLLMLWRVGDG